MLRPRAVAAVVLLLVVSPSIVAGQVRVIDSGLDYAAFAAAVAPRLAEIEAELGAWRGESSPPPDLDVYLNETETEVLATLEPKELAPLRDSIRLRFRRIRQKLPSATPARSSGIAFASFQPPGDVDYLDKFSLLAEAHAVLERLVTLARERRFSLRLCVVSRPDARATFRMRPPEYREGVLSGPTVLDREVALGRYFYKAEARKRKLPPIQCGWEGGGEDDQCLDLWDTPGDQLFECDFGEGSCELRNLPPGGCPAS